MASKWKYECDCHNCDRVQRIIDPDRHMDGDYCTATLEGLKTIHADDDYVIRCYCYRPMIQQTSFFND